MAVQAPDLQESAVHEASFAIAPLPGQAVQTATVSAMCNFPAERVFPGAMLTSQELTDIADANVFNWETISFQAVEESVVPALGSPHHVADANAQAAKRTDEAAANPTAIWQPLAKSERKSLDMALVFYAVEERDVGRTDAHRVDVRVVSRLGRPHRIRDSSSHVLPVPNASCGIGVRGRDAHDVRYRSCPSAVSEVILNDTGRVLRGSESSARVESSGGRIPSAHELSAEVQRRAATRSRRNSGAGGFRPSGRTGRAVEGDDRSGGDSGNGVHPRIEVVQVRYHKIPCGRSQSASAPDRGKGGECRARERIGNEDRECSNGEPRAFCVFLKPLVFHIRYCLPW